MGDKVSTGAKYSGTISNLMSSSPPRPPASHGKERRNPSITPRKLQRFFTPRSRISSKPSAARKALHKLTSPALNRQTTPSSPLKPSSDDAGQESMRGSKRRKLLQTPEHVHAGLPCQRNSSPSRPGLLSPIDSISSGQASQTAPQAGYDSEEGDEDDGGVSSAKRLVPLSRRGMGAQLFQRMTGSMPCAGNRALKCPVYDWRHDTADFQTTPNDIHMCSSHEGAPRCIPFTTAACHKNSLVAVGDEEGHVRLLDSASEFSKIHVAFQAHSNAVIDLAFSEDDKTLATASGDQTGKVFDMMTQTSIAVLGHHTASLKQVRFQPGRGDGAVLATSGRDGSVQIWDLRCYGGPVQTVAVECQPGLVHQPPRQTKTGCVVNSIYDAHKHLSPPTRPRSIRKQATGSAIGDVARVGEVPGRIGEVSVTALQFLPAGREHLLLSACEADATIKLWDIRSVHTSRHHKTSTPLSVTAPPPSHAAWRPFGISSMTLGGHGTRLYSVCKDNTIYAYSTAHLILGIAPELGSTPPDVDPPRRRSCHATPHHGLGPLYGLRHPLLHVTSFYIKASVRPARDGRSELLAVGSSYGCAVLFPTDERRLQLGLLPETDADYVGSPTANETGRTSTMPAPRPSLMRTGSNASLFGSVRPTAAATPIMRRGTPLVRGHDREVGALAFSSVGNLITVGDDYLVRVWSESREKAKELRRGGEGGGKRWACGWADVGDEWDGDDDDW